MFDIRQTKAEIIKAASIQNDKLVMAYIDIGALRAEIERLRARERKIIDETWGEALEDGSMPSTKLQDKIIAAVDALEQEARKDEPSEVTIRRDRDEDWRS